MQHSMNANFDLAMNQYLGPPDGDSYYQYNPAVFNFDVSAYPNLISEPVLPPNHSNLFSEYPPSYPSYPAAPDAPVGHPHMSVSSAQGGQMYPSVSDYPTSNGSYSWLNSPSSATMHPPTSLPVPPIPQQPQAADDDQRVQQELLGLLDGFQQPYDEFYDPMYNRPEGQMLDTLSIPSPYPGAGNDFADDSSPSSSLIKPPFDDNFGPDLTGQDDGLLSSMMKDDDDSVPESEDLSEINIRDLNKTLRDQGYSQEEQMEVKLIRRKQKNRVYAKNCRKNKEEKKTTMKTQKEQLEVEISDLKTDVERLRAQRNQYKLSYDIMQQRKQQS